MACRTASVERVVSKAGSAQQQIDKLEALIKSLEAAQRLNFYAQIETHLTSARISDARPLGENAYVKTEYASEFSLDKIANVVTSTLNAIKEATKPAGITPPSISAEAIEAYVNVVNAVAEAAKSSSVAAAGASFSMTRLSPGMFAFLSASSTNISDNETFGKEAITATQIHYRFIQSIDDLQLQGMYDAAKIEIDMNLQTFKKFKLLQLAIIDQLADGKIDLDTYDKLDNAYEDKARRLKGRIGLLSPTPLESTNRVTSVQISPNIYTELIRSAIDRLSKFGNGHKVVIEKAQKRIKDGYFLEELA